MTQAAKLHFGNHDDSKDKEKKDRNEEKSAKRGSDKFDRIGKIDTEMDSSHEESMEEDLEKNVTVPIAAFHPLMGMMTNLEQVQDISVPTSFEEKKSDDPGLVVNENQIVVHGLDGPYAN